MKKQQVTISVHIIKMMIRAGEQAGIDSNGVLQSIKLDPASLDNLDARIPMVYERQLWDELVQRSGDDFFGLHAGCTLTAGEFDVMDYAIRTSERFQQALENATRYNRLLHDVAVFELVTNSDEACFYHYFRDDPRGASWQATDFTLASIVSIGRALTGIQWYPNQIDFQHEEPNDTSEYKQLFGCPLVFRAERNTIRFDKKLLNAPVHSSDPSLQQVLCRHADALLANIPKTENIIDQVREKLVVALRGGNPTIEAIAEKLNMTARTLQRRLKEAETSHKELMEEMRKGLAVHYLDSPNLGIFEIAYMLGYSDPSAFHRAFKRWFNSTPAEYRLHI